jgi:uncharacterized membrane protein YfcA
MIIQDIFILLVAGSAGGFVGGLVGVGGGVIFAPVLLFYYQGIGVPHDAVAPLTIGTSLMCTFVVALFSARTQLGKRAVELKVAAYVGLASAVAALVMTRFVTTRPWFNADVFQLLFGGLLVFVSVQMGFGLGRRRGVSGPDADQGAEAVDPTGQRIRMRPGAIRLSATGLVAGTVATAAGVGGGIVLVPAYRKLFRFPIHRAVGTSSATIVLIAAAGVLSYMATGRGGEVSPYAVGYVDFGRAFLLSIPAALMAPIGVRTAHRMDQKRLNRLFALLAILVALRMLIRAVGLG